VTAVWFVVVRAPRRVVCPSPLQPGGHKRVCRGNARVEYAHGWSGVRRRFHTSGQFSHPVPLADPAGTAVEKRFDGAGRAPDFADCAGYAPGESNQRAGRRMDEDYRRIRED